MKILRVLKRIVAVVMIMCVTAAVLFAGINIYVKHKVKDKIIDVEAAKELDDVDCIIVLGASVIDSDTPSLMLKDRLEKGIELYYETDIPKLLMSGDHGGVYYDEVNVMKNYAIKKGVPSSDIFMDHAGFSTYESMYRAKEIFGAKKVIIVTQEYHLTRAIYIAEALGLEAYGVPAEDVRYAGQTGRDVREFLAIGKDFFSVIFKPEPSMLGMPIDISGDGDVTNDRD
ncbi:MAG: YdcF family protein [Lachnospiraceae bacterium]|nr:YdcF family protein [Lachnospiraceae bacterium]